MKAALVFLGVLVVVGGLGYLLWSVSAPPPVSPPGTNRGSARPPKPPRTRADPLAAEPPPHRPLAERGRPRFPSIPGHTDLDLRDWKEIAPAFVDWAQAQRERTERDMARTGPPQPEPPEEGARMEAAASRFNAAALAIPDGWDPAAAWTPVEHPAFVANLIAAVLDEKKLPLTESQAASLGNLARDHAPVVDAAAVPDELPDDGSYRLDLVLARATAVEDFCGRAFSLLTPAQAEVLSPDKWRGHAYVDQFTSWRTWVRTANYLRYNEPDRLVDTVTNGMCASLHLDHRRDEVRAVVAPWVAEIPFEPADVLERQGSVRVSRVLNDIRRTADLVHRIVASLQVPADVLRDARQCAGAYVPLLEPR